MTEQRVPNAAPKEVPAVEENVRAIRTWEKALLHDRTPAERFSDWITATAASGPVLIGHVIWFAVWVVINAGWVPGVPPFDPFPFSFLTMAVSLEAIFLALSSWRARTGSAGSPRNAAISTCRSTSSPSAR